MDQVGGLVQTEQKVFGPAESRANLHVGAAHHKAIAAQLTAQGLNRSEIPILQPGRVGFQRLGEPGQLGQAAQPQRAIDLVVHIAGRLVTVEAPLAGGRVGKTPGIRFDLFGRGRMTRNRVGVGINIKVQRLP